MRKVLAFIWKHKFLIIIFSLVIMFFVYRELGKAPKETKPGPIGKPSVTPSGPSYKSLIPGVSTNKEVAEKLGAVIQEEKTDEKVVRSYKSNNPNFPHQVTFDDEKVVFIKELVTLKDNKNTSNVQKQFGEPTYMLYKNDSPNSSFFLFVNPEKGFAYIGHPDGTLLEVWYFRSTNLEDFIKNWATNYSLGPPTIQVQ